MRNRILLLAALAVPILAVAAGTGRDPVKTSPPAVQVTGVISRPSAVDSALPQAAPQQTPGQAQDITLDWISINHGGETQLAVDTQRLGLSIAQPVVGKAVSDVFHAHLGFWPGSYSACKVERTGDVNISNTITSADIIHLVNFVFKGGTAPQPCVASGDINCNGSVTSADIIALVNFVFKGGMPPCDVCTVIPSLWSC